MKKIGRPKGGKNKRWSKEEKYKYLEMILTGEKSSNAIQKQYGISSGMLATWMKKYQEEGIDGLEPKRKQGNPLSKYQRRKELTPREQLEYQVLQLQIENLRLKKGYTNEEADRSFSGSDV